MNYGIPNVKPRNIIFTSGAQHAISSAIAALTEPGELILCEEIFYTGIKGVSTQLHRRKLMGVPIDEYGIIPERLREICELNKVKILVCCPNHQNPTAVVLTLERRIEIVKIAREFDLKIIEDDVFNYMSSDIPSLVELAPERTVYVTGMSKSLFVGMRLGILYTKASFFEPIATAVRTSIWTPSSLIMQLFSMWVEEGTAFKLADSQANEARERQILARQILEGADLSDNHVCSHLWLILPLEWELQSFLDTLQRNKVSVVSGDLFMMARLNPQKPSAIRISLLAPDTRKELIFGLKIIQKILKSPKHVPEFLMI